MVVYIPGIHTSRSAHFYSPCNIISIVLQLQPNTCHARDSVTTGSYSPHSFQSYFPSQEVYVMIVIADVHACLNEHPDINLLCFKY